VHEAPRLGCRHRRYDADRLIGSSRGDRSPDRRRIPSGAGAGRLALGRVLRQRKAADDYLAGTLDGLLVINEVTATAEDRMFCLSTERIAVLDNALLREQFTDWLRDPPALTVGGPDPNALPLAVLAWAFLDAKFPCDEPAGGAVDDDIRSRLLESVPDP
jgi:hypothetical protein